MTKIPEIQKVIEESLADYFQGIGDLPEVLDSYQMKEIRVIAEKLIADLKKSGILKKRQPKPTPNDSPDQGEAKRVDVNDAVKGVNWNRKEFLERASRVPDNLRVSKNLPGLSRQHDPVNVDFHTTIEFNSEAREKIEDHLRYVQRRNRER